MQKIPNRWIKEKIKHICCPEKYKIRLEKTRDPVKVFRFLYRIKKKRYYDWMLHFYFNKVSLIQKKNIIRALFKYCKFDGITPTQRLLCDGISDKFAIVYAKKCLKKFVSDKEFVWDMIDNDIILNIATALIKKGDIPEVEFIKIGINLMRNWEEHEKNNK